ncbi:Uncharacterised protein [Enterobacter cloacae]|nr:Uncharacterised protein [Enterobacter cloacae]
MFDSGLRRFGKGFNDNRLWFFALLNLFGNLNHLFGKGFNLFFAVGWLFRFDNRSGFDRRFRL